MALDSVLRGDPGLQDCAVECCHCGIRFLTHPRNARRIDLRCPFGCRQHHRRQQANRRSRAYYQSEEGKAKKKELNQRRSLACLAEECSPTQHEPPAACGNETVAQQQPDHKASANAFGVVAGEQTVEQTVEQPPPSHAALLNVTLEMQLGGVLLKPEDVVHSSLLPYLCEVASLLEGRTIGRHELVAALLKRMRQRSIGQLARHEYVLGYLNQQHPP